MAYTDTVDRFKNQAVSDVQRSNANWLGTAKAFGESTKLGLKSGIENIGSAMQAGSVITNQEADMAERLRNIDYSKDVASQVSDIAKANMETGDAGKKAVAESIKQRATNQSKRAAEVAEKYAGAPYLEEATMAGQGVGAMLPSIAAGAVTGIPTIGMTVMGGNVYGGAMGEALNDGANFEQAAMYGTTDAALEVGTEALFGGIPALGKGLIGKPVGEAARELTKKYIKTAAGRLLVNKLIDVTGEGAEEVVSGYVEPFLKRAFYDKDAENASLEDLIQSFKGGVLVSAILGIANVPGTVGEYQQNKADIAEENAVREKATGLGIDKKAAEKLTETFNEQTAGRFVEENLDADFVLHNGKYAMQKDGQTTPVTREMFDYAQRLKAEKVKKTPVKLDNTTAGINQIVEENTKTVELPNPANAGINEITGDINSLPQAQKKAVPEVSKLKEYVNTLSEVSGKNAENYLNKEYNNSGITAAQFVENNIDGNFYKDGKLYYMEKDGKRLPVKKSMYDYAMFLQSSAKDSNVPGKINIDTNVGAKTNKTVVEKTAVDTAGYGNAKVIGKRGNVDILDSVPDGWKEFDMQTAPVGYVGVTNNKSLFGGERKSALISEDVFVDKSAIDTVDNTADIDTENTKINDNPDTHTPEKTQKNNTSGTTAVNVGKATKIFSPYTGNKPTYTAPERKNIPQVAKESVDKATINIENAKVEKEQTGKSLNSILKGVYNKLFDAQGGAKEIKVNGVAFDNKDYIVAINKSAVKKVISDPNITEEKLAVFDNIRDIVANAEYVGSGDYIQHGAKQKNVTRYDYFETDIAIDGKPYLVTFDVEVIPGKNNYRTHRVINKISLTSLSSGEAVQIPTAALDAASNLSNNTIPQTAGNNQDAALDTINKTGDVSNSLPETNTAPSAEQVQAVINKAKNKAQKAMLRKRLIDAGKSNIVEYLESFERRTGIKIWLMDGDLQDINGFAKDCEMFLDISDPDIVLKTAVHEAIHLSKKNNLAKFNKLQERVFKLETDRNSEYSRVGYWTRNDYAQMGYTNKADIDEEVTAKLCEECLKDPEAFLDALGKEKTIVDTVLDILREIKNNIKIALSKDTQAQEQAKVDNAIIALERYLRGEAGNTEMKFSLKQPVEETKNLIAVHNIKAENVMRTLEMGGMPSPSIAITKDIMGHTEFGEISFLFDKSTVDPKSNKKNKIYSSDAYTPTFPTINNKYNSKVIRQFDQEISSIISNKGKELGLRHSPLKYKLDEWGTETPEELANSLSRRSEIELAYAIENGIDIDVPTKEKDYYFLSETALGKYLEVADHQHIADVAYSRAPVTEQDVEELKQVFEKDRLEHLAEKEKSGTPAFYEKKLYKKAIEELNREDAFEYMETANKYLTDKKNGTNTEVDKKAAIEALANKVQREDVQKWVLNKLDGLIEESGLRNNKDRFTPSGSRRSFKQLHDIVTLENIVKAMYSDKDSIGNGAFGRNILGSSAQEYSSISSMKADSDRLQTLNKPVYDKVRKELNERFSELASHFATRDSSYSSAYDLLCEAVAKSKTKTGIANYLKREGKGWTNYSDYVTDELWDIVQELKSMPQDYFESKPERVVYNNEIKGAVIPSDTSEDVKTALKKNGIEFAEYNKDSTEDRINKVNQVADKLGVKFSKKLTTDEKNIENSQYSSYTESKWITDNFIVSTREYEDFISKVMSIKTGTHFEKASNGLYIIPTGDEFGVNNTLVFTDGNPDNPTVEKVVHINLNNENDIEIVRDYIYGKEISEWPRKSHAAEKVFGKRVFSEYNRRDYGLISWEKSGRQRKGSKRGKSNNRLQQNRTGDSGQSSTALTGYISESAEDYAEGKNAYYVTLADGKHIRFNWYENSTGVHARMNDTTYSSIKEMVVAENAKIMAKDMKASIKTKRDAIPEEYKGMTTQEITKALIEKYGAIPKGEKPARDVSVPKKDMYGRNVSKGSRTIMEAEVTAEEMLDSFKKAVADGEFNYDINRDKDAVEKAVAYIEKYGFKNTYDEWRKKIDNKQAITKDDMTQALIMYASAVAAGDYDTAMKLATDISIQATKAGQIVQSMRILKKATPEDRLYYAQRSIDAIKDDIKEKYGDKAPEIKVDNKLLENLKKARTDAEIQEATIAINTEIAKQLPFSRSNFFNSWRYLAMLGNTRTQVRNLASNVIGTIAQEYTNFVQTGMETVLNTKEKTSAIKTTQWQREMAKADYELAKGELEGKGKYQNDSLRSIEKLVNPFDFKGKGGAVGKGMGKVLTKWNDVTNWAMDEGDKLFSKPAYERYYARYLAANKITNESQLTDKMKMSARSWAKKQSLESVYRESNALADWISKTETSLAKSNNVAFRTGAKVVGGIMPFRNTPLNITKRAFEYTPVGFAIELADQKYNKQSNPVELVNKAAKSLSGTSLIALGYALASTGFLSGGLGDDKEDKMKKQMGEQAYSINIGDYSYTMDWGGAGMMPLFIGAQMYENTAEDSENFFASLLDTLANASAPVMETSMMTGMMDALQTASYEDNAAMKITSFLASGLSSYLSQMVPTLFGQVARAVDDTSRSSYTNATGITRIFDKTRQKAENKIPFLSKTNVPYMDVWGNDVKNVGGNIVGRLLYNTLSPGYAEKKSTDKVETMLNDLYKKTGDTSVLPSNYTTYKRIGDETIRFTDKQYEQYTKTYGQTAYDLLEDLSTDRKFNTLEEEYQTEVIAKIYKYSTAIASNKVVDKELETRQANQKKALEAGISANHVFGGVITADENGNQNGSLSKQEVVDYIESIGGMNKLQKAYLFAALGNSNWKNPYA